MDARALQGKLAELVSEFNTTGIPPSADVAQTSGPAVAMREAKQLQESIDYIRLSIKYVLFDLEATRRENRYLRTMLEQRDVADSDFSDPDFDDDSDFTAS